MTNSTTAPNPIKESWKEQKTKIKTKFLTLTNTGLNNSISKKDEILNKLQIKFGKTKEELLKIISIL